MISEERIFELAEPFWAFKFGDAQGHKRIGFARAIEQEVMDGIAGISDELYGRDIRFAAETIEKLEKQRDELLKALKHYGTHLPSCDWVRRVVEAGQSGELPNECSCGLENVKGGA